MLGFQQIVPSQSPSNQLVISNCGICLLCKVLGEPRETSSSCLTLSSPVGDEDVEDGDDDDVGDDDDDEEEDDSHIC